MLVKICWQSLPCSERVSVARSDSIDARMFEVKPSRFGEGGFPYMCCLESLLEVTRPDMVYSSLQGFSLLLSIPPEPAQPRIGRYGQMAGMKVAKTR